MNTTASAEPNKLVGSPGPIRSHRLPATSTNTATWPYGSVRGTVANCTPAAFIRWYAASKSSTSRKNPTRPATWFPMAAD